MNHCIICNDVSDLPDVAKTILKSFPAKRIFIFKGELGAGKTTLIKALCNELKVVGITNSPSFAIVNEYPAADKKMIYHFDFYRIKKISEIFDIGYEEYFFSGNYCFVEWPEIAEQILPPGYVEISIGIKENKHTRIISFSEKTLVV